jgi:hypothetical protein
MDDDELYDTIHSAVRDALSAHKNPVTEAASLLLIVWLGIAAVDYLSHARWVNKFRYAVWYSVDCSQVKQSEDKPPHDCDFLKAPVGSKGCHYDKTVTYEHIIASHDTNTNRSIVSYDEGKTWSWNDGEYAVSASKTVYIGWQKIEE